ncbi:allose kinase [Diplocloster hominis]|uniref:allose kinase n=1 Tax=Diplocloster hominis TaxID=3079010 RepID=UPI0031BA073E
MKISSFSSFDYVIGIDIGGTNFRIGTITKDFKLSNCRRESSRKLFGSGQPADTISSFLSSYMETIPAGKCRGICLGFPGTVDKSKQTVFSCPNLPVITNQNIGAALKRQFQIPVIVEHDVILLLANDMQAFDLFGSDCVIALYVGTGLGNALYIHGRFLDGKNGVSGELGHIPVMAKKDPCPCGNQGCMELYCAGKRLEQIHREHYPEADMEDLFGYYPDSDLLKEYVDNIAIAAATEINILDPDQILLSGGVIRMKNFPYEQLLDRIHFHTRKPYPEQNLQFIRGMDDPFSGVSGAGIYMWNLIS